MTNIVFAMVVLVPTVLVRAVQEMTLERATYIYNLCIGRFLVDDMSVAGLHRDHVMLTIQYSHRMP